LPLDPFPEKLEKIGKNLGEAATDTPLGQIPKAFSLDDWRGVGNNSFIRMKG
jgi:hypothetical protein